MAACYRCKAMKGGKRRECRHSRPRPCRCGGMVGTGGPMPHRRGSRGAGLGACVHHVDHGALMWELISQPLCKVG
jgi:hypothetical protein